MDLVTYTHISLERIPILWLDDLIYMWRDMLVQVTVTAHIFFFCISVFARPPSHLLTNCAIKKLPIATMATYAAVGIRDLGKTLKTKGSRIMSTSTGGTLAIRVLFVV